VGKHGRVRTIPMSTWVKGAIDAWTSAAVFSEGPVLRRVNRGDQVQRDGMSEKSFGNTLQQYGAAEGVPGIEPPGSPEAVIAAARTLLRLEDRFGPPVETEYMRELRRRIAAGRWRVAKVMGEAYVQPPPPTGVTGLCWHKPYYAGVIAPGGTQQKPQP